MIWKLEKEKGRRAIHYSIFPTNSPLFRKAFNISLNQATITFKTFKDIALRILTFKEVISIKNDNEWEIKRGTPIIDIGVGGKNFDFTKFLLDEKDEFALKRRDGKKHLENDFTNIHFPNKNPYFESKETKIYFFKPPDNFTSPDLVRLDFVDKSGGRRYCYVRFESF